MNQLNDTRGEEPKRPPQATANDVKEEYLLIARSYTMETEHWKDLYSRYTIVMNWVMGSVAQRLMTPHYATLVNLNALTLQNLVRSLRKHLAPPMSSLISTARQEYRDALNQAKVGRISPTKWHEDWSLALAQARLYGVAEIEGTLAIKDFLDAVATKMAPEWGRQQLVELIGADEFGQQPNRTLEEYGLWFAALANENAMRSGASRGPAIFATLGGLAVSKSTRSTTGTNVEKHQCVCGRSHRWPAEDCRVVQLAVTGECKELNYKPTQKVVDQILANLKASKWKDLRGILEKKGWKIPEKSTQSKQFPGSINAAIIDPALLYTSGIYASMDFSTHPLSASTLLDNCGATHLVNDKSLLIEGSFSKSTFDDCVHAGSSSFPISGRGKRVLRRALNGASGNNTEDLVLEDVAVVEGFHVNIVSEARLRSAGVWYSGFDCSLRFGGEDENVVVKKLLRKYNLVFLEYKPLSFCLNVPACIPTSAAGIVVYSTLERNFKQGTRRSREHLKPRTDTEDVWHKRAGHLGPKALQKLVTNVRNVRIEGTARLKCQHCAVTHANQVISRQPSEGRAPRPFFRIQWDLFDFPIGYDGSQWLLMIKDEYSGKLFGYLLSNKSLLSVFNGVKNFERWVRRQYGLSICKIKHDNDTSVIGINGKTEYELWIEEEGIELELSPSYTHESNGGAERAGQEAIVRSIKMRLSANLPEKLWPECVLAAIFLYNISPLQARDFKSPNETLMTWFRTYFRWYQPDIVSLPSMDLRSEWNGIYAYGCRAYPMMKDKEAGRNKRAFKVNPRGHVGYLVGYVASNIYRIWIPTFDRVICYQKRQI